MKKTNKKLNILFVCKYNRFRSRVAEAYFKKINKNKKRKADSAGLFEGFPINKKSIIILKSLGINIKGKPRAISTKLLSNQDLVIIVADDVPKSIFDKKYVKKLIVWKIKDVDEVNRKKVQIIAMKIIKKVNKLNKILNKK